MRPRGQYVIIISVAAAGVSVRSYRAEELLLPDKERRISQQAFRG